MRPRAALVLTLALAACAAPPAPRPVATAPAPTVRPQPSPAPVAAAPAPAPAPRPTPTPAPKSATPAPASDTCGARSLQYLVGRPRTEIPVPVDPSRRRVVCTTCPMTLDYSAERLNILFDQATGLVKEVKCG